jgi:membrane dipeptidase
MDRREFLKSCVVAGVSLELGIFPASASASRKMYDFNGIRIADPHAHPYQLHKPSGGDASTPSLEMMHSAGMVACAFSAVSDVVKNAGISPERSARGCFGDTLDQLETVLHLERGNAIRLILSKADVPSSPGVPLGALMAVEGGDALEGDLDHLGDLYDLGVRMITLLHNFNNEIGFNSRSTSDGPLTSFGIEVVEKMNEMGMLIDVAHANTETLESIAEVTAAPLIDSHTNPLPVGFEPTGPTRLRNWREMELIAETGGIVCTWPLAYAYPEPRLTVADWARETALMKSRLGIEHCGFGTDSGGNLPQKVAGWVSYASLPALVEALKEAGFSHGDLGAYFGGNFLRLLKKCLPAQPPYQRR